MICLVVVVLILGSFLGEAHAQSPVLPLPASDQQQLSGHLGAGVVGAALPSQPILDVSSYFPLRERTLSFRVTSGANAGNLQTLSLKQARRPGSGVAWRFNFAPSLFGFINVTARGDLIMPAVSDVDEGVISLTSPTSPFMLKGMKPGETRRFAQKISVNYLDDPTRRDWGGRLNANFTYVGTYQVTVPAGTFEAILLRSAYRGKVGPADVVYTAWYFFARDTGIVAMVTLEDISAFWIYHSDSTTGKVLAVK
jgi:hypothetical protein